MLAEALDVVTLTGGAVGTIVTAAIGYGVLRANVKRNTERINNIEATQLTKVNARVDGLDDRTRRLESWRDREQGAAIARREMHGHTPVEGMPIRRSPAESTRDDLGG